MTKQEMLSTITKKIKSSKLMGYNTIDIYYEDGSRVVKYDGRDFYIEYPDGIKVVRGGGCYYHRTATAISNRLNNLTPLMTYASGRRIFSNRLDCYLPDYTAFGKDWTRQENLNLRIEYAKKKIKKDTEVSEMP